MNSYLLRIVRLALYFMWTLSLMPIQWAGLALGCRWVETLPAFYHRWCCRILGFRVRLIGKPTAERPALFAANHVSYTDITILGSLIPGSFIAKAEVAKWPFFGWLAKLQRTVFVDRQIRSTAIQRDAISERLVAGDALILFPEGTSGDGNRPLPFKTALFAAAARRADHPICGRSTRFARLYAARRHTDRAILPTVFLLVRGGRFGAPFMGHDRARHGRSGGPISSADISRRLRVAQGAGRLLPCADCRRNGRRALRSAAANAEAPGSRRSRGTPALGIESGSLIMEQSPPRGDVRNVVKRVFIKTYGCQMNIYDFGTDDGTIRTTRLSSSDGAERSGSNYL